ADMPVHGAAIRRLRGQLPTHRGRPRVGESAGPPGVASSQALCLDHQARTAATDPKRAAPGKPLLLTSAGAVRDPYGRSALHALCDSLARHDRVLDRGNRESDSQHDRDREKTAAIDWRASCPACSGSRFATRLEGWRRRRLSKCDASLRWNFLLARFLPANRPSRVNKKTRLEWLARPTSCVIVGSNAA